MAIVDFFSFTVKSPDKNKTNKKIPTYILNLLTEVTFSVFLKSIMNTKLLQGRCTSVPNSSGFVKNFPYPKSVLSLQFFPLLRRMTDNTSNTLRLGLFFDLLSFCKNNVVRLRPINCTTASFGQLGRSRRSSGFQMSA